MNVKLVGQHAARWRRSGGGGGGGGNSSSICLACRLGMGMRLSGGGSGSNSNSSSNSRRKKRIDRPMIISLHTTSVRSGYGHGRSYRTARDSIGKQAGCRSTIRVSDGNNVGRLRAGGFNNMNQLGSIRSVKGFGDLHILDNRGIAGLGMMQRQLYSTRGRDLPLEDERQREEEELIHGLGERMTGSKGEAEELERTGHIFVERSAVEGEEEDLFEQGYMQENVSEADMEKVEGPHTLERSVRAIRQAFGEDLPDGVLTDEAYALYVRLYGPPLRRSEANYEEENEGIIDAEEGGGGGGEDAVEENALYKTGKDGKLEEVEYEEEEEAEDVIDMQDTKAMKAEEIIEAEQNDTKINLGEESQAGAGEIEEEMTTFVEAEDHTLRAHPLTKAGRFQTLPTTVQLSRSTFVKPVSDMLSDVSNKHLKETAHETFGGFGLPLSTATPKRTGQHIKQRPIALQAGQRHMSEREGDVFMAALMPGMYASVVSALAEVRRRLGSSWLEGLLSKNDSSHLENDKDAAEGQKRDGDGNTVRGPLILDAGSGGAAVFAFRDTLKAEWERMNDVPNFADNETQTVGPPPPSPLTSASSSSSSSSPPPSTIKPAPVPTGRATVLTGSASLRHRASRLLSDTTFLPRLPDTVPNATEPDPNVAQPRKRYDIIVASHTLWPLDEPYLRKQHVERLWSLLNPDGGVLVILEKGLPRGFEAVAGARALLLDRFIASPGSLGYERVMPSTKKNSKDTRSSSSLTPDAKTDPPSVSSATSQFIEKEPGMIIAPCTNHSTCPMYTRPGITTGRKDLCHFSQRFFRPQYLQNILGARDKNFDDVLFSYVAVRRGWDGRRRMEKNGQSDVDGADNHTGPYIAQGELATAAAFGGYEDEFMPSMSDTSVSESTSTADMDNNNVGEIPIEPSIDSKPTTKMPIEAYIPPDTTLNQTLLSLPRTILPPLKRRGHVILDLCTPAGRLERWTVPRSFSKQAYRDARKSRWGDLWALGAKTRVVREPRVGKYGRRSRDASEVEEEDESGKRNKETDLGEEIFSGLGVDADGRIDDGIDGDIEREFMEDLERSGRGFGGAGGGFNESMDRVAKFRESTRVDKGGDENSRAGRRRGNNKSNERRPGKAGRKEDDDYDGGILSMSESVSPLGNTSLLDALSFGEEENNGKRSRSQRGVERREHQAMMRDQEVERRREKRMKKEMARGRRAAGGGKEDKRQRRR